MNDRDAEIGKPMAADADQRPGFVPENHADVVERPDGEAGLVLRAEQLDVRTERVVTERVILRRRIVTEERTITVPVRREVIEVVREPATGGEVPASEPFEADAYFDEAGAGDVEMIAHTEVPVVTMQVVPIERVRLVRQNIVTEVPVSAEVSREQASVEHIDLEAEHTPRHA